MIGEATRSWSSIALWAAERVASRRQSSLFGGRPQTLHSSDSDPIEPSKRQAIGPSFAIADFCLSIRFATVVTALLALAEMAAMVDPSTALRAGEVTG